VPAAWREAEGKVPRALLVLRGWSGSRRPPPRPPAPAVGVDDTWGGQKNWKNMTPGELKNNEKMRPPAPYTHTHTHTHTHTYMYIYRYIHIYIYIYEYKILESQRPSIFHM